MAYEPCPTLERGEYYGYDGPAPPLNGALQYRYIFTLYALDVPRLDVPGRLTRKNVRDALAGHVFAEASLTGVYSLNPNVRSRSGMVDVLQAG
jgi:phosphatidylethanolamine-binding protein (PEBP) family uncharacterized protein